MKYIKDILGEWAVRDFSTFAVFLHLEAEEQNNFLPSPLIIVGKPAAIIQILQYFTELFTFPK